MKNNRLVNILWLFIILSLALPAPLAARASSNSQSGPPAPQSPQGPYLAYLSNIARTESSGGGGGGGGRISDLNVLTPQVARYERFEAHFQVQTDASNFSMPFDANPPSGLNGSQGVSVDVLFSPDNWNTTLVQPAFYDVPFDVSDVGGWDHYTPSGAPHWSVRFAPQQEGAWQFRIRVRDQAGEDTYPAQNQPGLGFQVGAPSGSYASRGFLRVSPTDSRYFEFQNGKTFTGIGFNDGFDSTSSVEAKMASYEANGMDFMRVWLSGSGINGSQWTSWASHHLDQDGYLPGVSLDTSTTYNGGDVSMRLDDANPCLYSDFWQHYISVEPNTTYKVWARVKLENVGNPGFIIKQGDWLDKGCSQDGTGTPITNNATGSTDWMEVSGDYTTGSDQYYLNYLYLARLDGSGGQVYIDEVRLYKADDSNQVNLLREPKANSQMYFDPINSTQWDHFIQSAEQHGVYLKLVIDEKNEWIRNRISSDGSMTDPSNDNFYAASGTKGRWLQEAWWRYLIARWGYSTAIHSFEYINEGDPYNGNLYDISNAMAQYFHQNDPSRHMVTTSFWASFPNAEFWSNPAYSAIDYADLHAYISTGWGQTATMLSDGSIETNPANVYTGSGSARISGADNDRQEVSPRSLVIRGAGEYIIHYWMKADSFTASCPYGTSGGMQRVRWMLDGGTYYGGKEGIAPANQEGKDFICSSPAGSFGWIQFSSDKDRAGNAVPESFRLILTDDQPHSLAVYIENSNGTGGTAWFDEITLTNPDGSVSHVLGEFDATPMDEDTAWYNHAYADVFGGRSEVGARKPLVRGETGIDFEGNQDWNRDLSNDTDGIWLHNNLWGQINHGGMYDLFWWASETIPESIYKNFKAFHIFMDDIPLSNGSYYETSAQAPDGLRVWGQQDDVHGRLHLWVQNTAHTWRRVVDGGSIPAIGGSITLNGVPAGNYRVQWWDPYATGNAVIKEETVSSDGNLTLSLPYDLQTDVGIKIEKQ